VHRVIYNALHVMWLDNFNKFIGVRVQNMDKGLWLNCSWTGQALTKHCGDPDLIDLTITDDQRGMPDDIWRLYDVVVAQLEAVCEQGKNLAKHSIVETLDVRRVPLKMDPKKLPDGPLKQKLLKRSAESLHNFYPIGMIDENIGANRGFLRILWDVLQKAKADPRQRIQLLSTDSNIYFRIMKVRF
jgi:hypothetical protein